MRKNRGMRRLTVYVPDQVDALVERIADTREKALGTRPVAADIIREALVIGLRTIDDAARLKKS